MIKANDGYALMRRETNGKVHLYKQPHGRSNSRLCKAKYPPSVVALVDACDIDDLCGHCAKHRDTYRELPEHITKALERVDELEAEVRSYHKPVQDPIKKQLTQEETLKRITEIGGGLVKPVQDPIKAKLHEYECRAKAAEDEVVELKELIMRLEKKNENLKGDYGTAKEDARLYLDQRNEARRERDELRQEVEDLHKSRGSYMLATKGHTLENIATMMKAMPPAESLEGYDLTLKRLHKGDEHYNELDKCWETQLEYPQSNVVLMAFVRTPIVEYIPTEEITDELVEKHGRIPCEWSTDGEHWRDGKLVEVDMYKKEYFVRFDKNNTSYRKPHCRIKAEIMNKD